MSKLNEKQLLVATVVAPALLIGGVAWLAWSDWQKIYAAEMTDEHPEAAEITDPEAWGERRKCQEIQKQMELLRGQADLIGKREQDVIVYREITQRDSQILPDNDFVVQFTKTINDFEKAAGVTVTSVGDLNVVGASGQAIARLPIRLSLSGTFDQFLKFVNMFETMDRLVNTRSFSISAGARQTDDPNSPVLHQITLELETFVYNAGAGLSKPVAIDNYDRRKEDPVIQKLVRQQKAARVEKYQLKPRINRRDPLVDPRRELTSAVSDVAVEEFNRQKQSVERLRGDVQLLKEDVLLLQQYQQEQKYLQIAQLEGLIDERVQTLETAIKDADPKITVPELRDQFSEEVVAPFTRIASERRNPDGPDGGKRGPTILTRAQLVPFIEKQRAALEAKDYETVVQVGRNFDELVGKPRHKLAEDTAEIVAEIRENARVSAVAIEFLGLNLKVTGLIKKSSGSIVIINNKPLKVGAYVDDRSRCRLVEIRDESLLFEMEGCQFDHALDRR